MRAVGKLVKPVIGITGEALKSVGQNELKGLFNKKSSRIAQVVSTGRISPLTIAARPDSFTPPRPYSPVKFTDSPIEGMYGATNQQQLIGGRRRRATRRSQKGGFYPSVFEGVRGAAMLTPLAMRQAYRLWSSRKARSGKRNKKSKRITRKR